MKISLVLLTRNEITGVSALWDKIPFDAVDEAFAVDGGSTDGTLEFYKQKGLPVVEQVSRGRGEAFRLAFEHAKGDALLFYSPDGNEDPADIPRFRALLEAGADMVIASRMMRGAYNEEDEHWFRPRKWANNAFNAIANLCWNRGPYVTDSINGFRAVTRAAWQRMQPDGPGYTIEYQSTIRAFKLRLKITEFPTRESSRIGGESQAKSIPTGLKFLRLYAREMWVGKRFADRTKTG